MGGNVVLHIPAFFIFVTAMYPFLNIHTHRPDARGGVCPVLCAEPSDFLRGADSAALYSVGHHPWRVGSQSRAELATMAQLLLQKQVVAVGEIGLDKVCDADFRLQQEFFKFQLRMAACVRKPVVVHCVKAWSELLETLSQVEDLPPVVIHGFRGKSTSSAADRDSRRPSPNPGRRCLPPYRFVPDSGPSANRTRGP